MRFMFAVNAFHSFWKGNTEKAKALCPFWKGRNGRLSHRYTGYKTHRYQTQSDLPVLDHNNSTRTQEAYPFWTTMSVSFWMVLTGPQSAHTRKQVHLPVMDTIPLPETTYRLWIQYSYSSRPTSYGHNTRTQDDLPAMNTIPVLKTTNPLWIQYPYSTRPTSYGHNTRSQDNLQVMDRSNQNDLPVMDIIPVIKTTYPLRIQYPLSKRPNRYG